MNFLQTGDWAGFQRGLGRDVLEKTGEGWSYLAVVERGRFSSRLYCPLGPVASGETPEELKLNLSSALADLQQVARRRRLDLVRVEPTLPGDLGRSDQAFKEALASEGAKKTRSIQPEFTWIKDISAGEEAVLNVADPKLRNYYRRCLKEGIEFEFSYDPADAKLVVPLLEQVAARTGMRPMPPAYFQTLGEQLFASKSAGIALGRLNGETVVASMFYFAGDAMIYAHSAASDALRKFSPSAAALIFAQLEGVKRGAKWIDFWGISPDGAPADDKWQGFTQFKMKFGGERLNRLGAFDLPINRAKYTLYEFALRLLGKSH